VAVIIARVGRVSRRLQTAVKRWATVRRASGAPRSVKRGTVVPPPDRPSARCAFRGRGL